MQTIYKRLGEVLSINRSIRRISVEIESLEMCLLPSGISYDGVNVQTSPSDRMLEVCAKIGDLEAKKKELISNLPDAIERVTDLINQLQDGIYRDVLMYWYIGGFKAYEIMEKVYYAEEKSVYRARRKAVEQLKQIEQLDTECH